MNLLKFPAPYFGGKSMIASDVWAALGQPEHYIEPCFGSGAVLLARQGYDSVKHTETVNDADGYVSNLWRALQGDPDGVAKYCDYPINHADLSARKRYMLAHKDTLLQALIADDTYYDVKIAGYWIWSACCWIGAGLTRLNQIPRLTSKGQGVHAVGKRPHLGNKGIGVHVHSLITTNTGTDVREPYNTNIYVWFRALAERLRYVRVVCGDWSRVCGGDWQDSTWKTVGIFFDPPYAVSDRDSVYDVDSFDIAHDIRCWSIERGSRANYRIVIAGYEEHIDELTAAGWTYKRWKTMQGYANTARNGKQTQGKDNSSREVLYFSPHCINNNLDLFNEPDD